MDDKGKEQVRNGKQGGKTAKRHISSCFQIWVKPGLVVLFGGGEEKLWIGREIQVLFRWAKIHQISLIV